MSFLRDRNRGSIAPAAALALIAALGQACSFDWDAYDPRLDSPSGAGGAGGGAGAGGAASSSSSSGSSTSSTSSTSSSSSGGGAGGAGGATTGSGGAGGGGTGGGGGGPTMPCGGVDILSDAFDDEVAGPQWYWNINQNITFTETNGEATFALNSNSASSEYAAIDTKRLYDLRNRQVWVEVKEVGAPATSAQTFLTIARDSNNFIEMSQAGGTLFFSKRQAGASIDVGTVLYNAQAHRFWRIRDDGVATYWETSADGQTYVVRAQLPTDQLFPLDAVRISIGAQLDGGEVNPGKARFANINGGGAPTGEWCPTSALTDDFENGVVDLRWDNWWDDTGTKLVETGGQMVMGPPDNMYGYCALVSGSAYDLTGDAVAVEVPQVVNQATIASTFFRLEADGYGTLEFTLRGGTLKFEKEVAGVGTTLASTLYQAAQHKWWRFREGAGTLYWETSPDGKAWAVVATDVDPFPMTSLDVVLGSGAYQAVVGPGESHFDNLNFTP